MTTQHEYDILCIQHISKKGGEYMTQDKNVKRIAEFNAIFLTLNKRGQEAALTILQSLKFAQTAMFTQMEDENINKEQNEDKQTCELKQQTA